MRLSDILSKPPQKKYQQIESFLSGRKGKSGQQVKLNIGDVAINYFCEKCDDMRTFSSKGKLVCIFVNNQIISIDCVLSCGCGAKVQKWFLVECDSDITNSAPNVRILKRSEKLPEFVKLKKPHHGEISILLDLAERAYWDNYGAGSIVYLRKAYEKITVKTAQASGIEYKKHDGGNPKNFSELLKKVDEKCHIIPGEFSQDGYKLFKELSTIVHGDYEEQKGLSKFESLHRLVVGILDNIRNTEELNEAIITLGWYGEE